LYIPAVIAEKKKNETVKNSTMGDRKKKVPAKKG
jgi:hypothetical protein